MENKLKPLIYNDKFSFLIYFLSFNLGGIIGMITNGFSLKAVIVCLLASLTVAAVMSVRIIKR